MAEVKWIKITTDIFDDEKILLIESLPDGKSINYIWIKLLCLAGKQNNSGVFSMSNGKPYTEKMLATILRESESMVKLALKTFEEYGMIELIDGIITISNWGKHQNLDQLENKRAYQRTYMQQYRAKQKELSTCKANSKSNVSPIEEDKNRIDKNKKENINYQLIADMYNDICISFPRVKSLSDSRKKAINARLKKYTVDDFKLLFEKAEASDFLKGTNNRDWQASFDWLIKDSNFAKVLDGNYDQKENKAKTAGETPDFLKKWSV